MLDRESACNRVFLACRFVLFGADGVGLRFKPVFNLAAAQRSTMSSPLPYCRTNQTSSDVGMIGMITASARHRWTYRRRNGTKRKFFNDFSRARACAYAQGGVRSEHASLCRVWRAVCFKKRYLVRDRRQDRTALRCPAVRHVIWSRALYVEREIGRPFGLWQFSWPHFCRPSPGCFPVDRARLHAIYPRVLVDRSRRLPPCVRISQDSSRFRSCFHTSTHRPPLAQWL